MGKDTVHAWAGDYSPLKFPWIRPTMRLFCMATAYKNPGLRNDVSREEQAAAPATARNGLILLFARFFAAALARQRFFDPLLFTGLQVKRVTLYFLDGVLLLYLTLEAAKRILQGLALLNSDFSQTCCTPLLAPNGLVSYGKARLSKSSRMYKIPALFQKTKRSPSCTSRGAYALVDRMKLAGR